MKNSLQSRLEKFYGKYKSIILNIFFGILLLANLIAIPYIIKKITITLSINGWKYINPLSPIWYERTKEAKIFFEQQNINFITACCIIASLLYSKHTRVSFVFLIIPIILVIVRIII